MLLQALLACAGVTMRSVATAMGIDVVSAKLEATGMFDARGTLGMSRDLPIGVQDVSVVAELETDADDAMYYMVMECGVPADAITVVPTHIQHRDGIKRVDAGKIV